MAAIYLKIAGVISAFSALTHWYVGDLSSKPYNLSNEVSPAKATELSLDKVKMNVVKTAQTGVVNHETIFHFSQDGDRVFAEYQGGKIQRGFLVGKLTADNRLAFTYCQMQKDGKLDNGVSDCELAKNEDGKLVLIERFEWKSRPGEFGTNIFQEMR
jgi:hypothetical protein